MKMLQKDKKQFNELSKEQQEIAQQQIETCVISYPVTMKDYASSTPDTYFDFYLPYGDVRVKLKPEITSK